MEISENKFRSTEHGSVELRWLYMWDPEYSDSELGGKSRDEMCPYTRANSAGGAPRRVTKDNKLLLELPKWSASSRPLAEFLAICLLKGHCIKFKYYADGIHSGLTPPG